MNSFFLRTDNTMRFLGRINEDVNTYTLEGNRGRKFFTIPRLRLAQHVSQGNEGGMTDLYVDVGTYVKSFYTVMGMPSSVYIWKMGVSDKRFHHHIDWKHTVPQIVSEEVKKSKGKPII